MKTLDKIKIGVYTLVVVLVASLFVSCEKLGLGDKEKNGGVIFASGDSNLGTQSERTLKTSINEYIESKIFFSYREEVDPNPEINLVIEGNEIFDIYINGKPYTKNMSFNQDSVSIRMYAKNKNLPVDSIQTNLIFFNFYYKGDLDFVNKYKFQLFHNLSPLLDYEKRVAPSIEDTKQITIDWQNIRDRDNKNGGYLNEFRVTIGEKKFVFDKNYIKDKKWVDKIIYHRVSRDLEAVNVEVVVQDNDGYEVKESFEYDLSLD